MNQLFDTKMPNYTPMILSDHLSVYVTKYLQVVGGHLISEIEVGIPKESWKPPKNSKCSVTHAHFLRNLTHHLDFISGHNFLDDPADLSTHIGSELLSPISQRYADLLYAVALSKFPVKETDRLKKISPYTVHFLTSNSHPLFFLRS